MSDINSIIKTEDLDNISDNDLYEVDEEENQSSVSQQSSNTENNSESNKSSDHSSDSSDDDQSEYEDSDSDSSVDFHDLDDDMPDNTEIIKSKNEILNEPIPDIDDIKNIKISLKDQKYMKLGKVYKKIISLNKIIVESDISGNEYIIDTSKAVLFKIIDDKARVVGLISEIFGPITKPYYTISFKPDDIDIFNDVEMRDDIYILIDENFKLIKTSNIKLLKGSDASNFNDEEVLDDKDIEFSDDEKEREWKKQQKNKKTNNKVEKSYVSRSSRNTNTSTLEEKNVKDMDVNKLKMILGPAVVKKQAVTKPAPKNTAKNDTKQEELLQKLNSLPKEELVKLISQMNGSPQQTSAVPYAQQMPNVMNNQPQFPYPGYNMAFQHTGNMYPYMIPQYQQYPQQGIPPQGIPPPGMQPPYIPPNYGQGHMNQAYMQQYMPQGNQPMNIAQNLQHYPQPSNTQMNNHQQNLNNSKSGYTFGQGLNKK
ncbi:hypothetical protein ACO0R3_004136 [Hanseniaspora guilliermondii]